MADATAAGEPSIDVEKKVDKKSEAADDAKSKGKEAKTKDSMSVFDLPNSVVARILKSAVPGTTMGRDAKLAISKATGFFVLYLASTANDLCRASKRSTISGEDVLNALEECDMYDMTPDLMRFLDAVRKEAKIKRQANMTDEQKAAEDDKERQRELKLKKKAKAKKGKAKAPGKSTAKRGKGKPKGKAGKASEGESKAADGADANGAGADESKSKAAPASPGKRQAASSDTNPSPSKRQKRAVGGAAAEAEADASAARSPVRSSQRSRVAEKAEKRERDEMAD